MEIKLTTLTTDILKMITNKKPSAFAVISGKEGIQGTVCFYSCLKGSLMIYEIKNLPISDISQGGVYAFHIHAGKTCKNLTEIPYEKTLGHFNPQECKHPYHIGDLPPLFSTKGIAWAMIYIDKFKPDEIIGRTIVIHEHADDFHSQPSGNSGNKIACGEIKKFMK
jgi:Cu/Zn superoxide dismutase